jgi:hypothetical protein
MRRAWTGVGDPLLERMPLEQPFAKEGVPRHEFFGAFG